MSLTGIPIQNLPFMYDNNLLDSWTSTTTLTLSAGQCRDSTNVDDIVLSSSVLINAANRGLNGLDAGSLANNTWYYLFVISDPVTGNPTGALLSTSKTAPLIPFGYSAFRYIGAWRTDGSAHFLPMWKYGNAGYRMCYWDAPVSVLSGGSASSFTAISLVSGIPTALETSVLLQAIVTPTAAGNDADFRPSGSSSTNGMASISGDVAAVATEGQITVPCKIATVSAALVPAIDYRVTGTLSLSIAGFQDYM